jgi:hypothetical protein
MEEKWPNFKRWHVYVRFPSWISFLVEFKGSRDTRKECWDWINKSYPADRKWHKVMFQDSETKEQFVFTEQVSKNGGVVWVRQDDYMKHKHTFDKRMKDLKASGGKP